MQIYRRQVPELQVQRALQPERQALRPGQQALLQERQ